MMHKLHKGSLVLALALFGLFIAACGGGGGGGGGVAGGGIGGSGVTSGTISAFGSVFVNGIEFETDGASRDVDDETDVSNGSDDDTVLAIGMVVTILGTVNPDGISGTADSIFYDDEIEGPVTATPVEDSDGNTKSFEIFGVTIIVDRNTTVFDNTDYDTLAQNDLLEVSGFFDGTGNLLATRVEKEGVLVLGNSEVELKGTVSGFNGVDTFVLDGVTVTFDGTTEFDDLPGSVTDGQFVEVEGILDTAISITATRIELEDDGFDNNVDKVSIEGLVTNFQSNGNFRVAGQKVNANNATFEPASLANNLADGVKVEVEGSIEAGILRANEVERRGGDVRVSAVVSSRNISAGTITLTVVPGQPTLTVFVDTQTQFEDQRDDEEPFGITGISSGDYLEIRGLLDGNGDFIASEVERDDLDDTELRGPADVPPTSGSTAAGTVTIFGISITTNASTDFEDVADTPLTGTDFFLQVNNGDLVNFKDEDAADGLADEVEFED